MIRAAKYSDLHQIRYLAQTSFAPYAVRSTFRAEPFSADPRELVAQRKISVFLRENAVRGFICYHIDGPDVHIESLAVGPKYRRRGVGRMLLDHADRRGLRAGCRRAILYTNAQMFENYSYYLAKGFRETERRFEEGYERIYLERYLR